MREREWTAADWLATAVGLLGAAVVAGYGLHSSRLVQLRPGQNAAIVLTAAISFILAALALVSDKRRRTALTLLLLGLNLAVFLENAAGWTLDVDLPRTLAWIHEHSVHPGRMPPLTNWGFLLFGAALLLLGRPQRRRSAWMVRWLTWLVMAAGVAGVLSYFLHLDLLYNFHEVTRPALPSGGALFVLGLALWLGWRQRRWNDSPEGEQAGLILAAATLALVAAVVVAGVSGLIVVQHMARRDAAEDLALRRQERVNYVSVLIEQAAASGRIYATQPSLAARLHGGVGRGDLRPLATPSQNFSSITLYLGSRAIASYGHAIENAPVSVPLPLGPGTKLIWSTEFYLLQSLPVGRGNGRLGRVVIEQPILLLASIGMESSRFGATGEVGLCGQKAPGSSAIECFPQRMHPTPYRLLPTVAGVLHPMVLAMNGKTGVADTIDYRGQRVLAAYAPIPDLGLGLVVKMDARELYAPVRRLIDILGPLLAAIAVGGLQLMRWRVHPLVSQLVASRNQAVSNEARFRAAAESGMDPFYIFESIRRSGSGSISGFHLIYANHPGEVFAGLEPGQGQSLSLAAVPQLHAAAGVQEKLRRVVMERRGWVEEFSVPDRHHGQAEPQWILLQAVALGDGVAVTLRDISQRKREEERLLAMAQSDPLTGLANRSAFQSRLTQAMENSHHVRRQALLAVLYLDIDHFKSINDTLGHSLGDKVLRAFAGRLLGCVRSADTVARPGGDEFAILLENLESSQDAERVVEGIFASLRDPVHVEQQVIDIATSIGLAYYQGEEISAEELLRRADTALYVAKRAGRNGWQVYA
ncbi:MAG: diguanylate cyclase domain-containing protein [Terriglobales bacterium]